MIAPRAAAQTARPDARLADRFAAAALDWIVPAWPAPASVHAFVTTRTGTSSPEEFLPSPPRWLEQVHGARVATARAIPGNGGRPPRADAAVTRDANVVLAVRAADCLPVLFCTQDGTAIGIAHAGWRGLAAGVLENTVAAMDCAPSTIVAWFGPAIGRTAFEVGADVREAFVATDAGAASAFTAGRRDKWFADLEQLARRRLVSVGVQPVSGGGLCTVSDPARFFSFRRDRSRDRMGAFLWRTDPR
jgi:hypothetical protein